MYNDQSLKDMPKQSESSHGPTIIGSSVEIESEESHLKDNQRENTGLLGHPMTQIVAVTVVTGVVVAVAAPILVASALSMVGFTTSGEIILMIPLFHHNYMLHYTLIC